jgi:hypothetical protein
MSWLQLHGESERLAISAEVALKNRDLVEAMALYRRAAELEQSALEAVDSSKERTRGVTAVSAVALWYKAHEYVAAEKLACAILTEALIPPFARDELKDLLQAIWTESAKQKAGVNFIPGQVLVSVKGGEVVTGGAPLDLIVDKVQTIQSLFFRTIEMLRGLPLRKVGRPPKELQESCRPWLFQSAPGSYQFTVAIEKPRQPDFFRKDFEPEEIASKFLEIVGASASGDDKAIEDSVPDEGYRNTFLKLTRNLSPAGKAFERIDLRSPGDPHPVAIGTEARDSINRRLQEKSDLTRKTNERTQELRGTLRAVHLDQDWLEVVVDNASIRVAGLQDAVDDVIGPMVNRSVVVKLVRKGQRNKFIDIELAE